MATKHTSLVTTRSADVDEVPQPPATTRKTLQNAVNAQPLIYTYWKDQPSPIRLLCMQKPHYYGELDGHLVDTARRDTWPFLSRAAYVPPEFLTCSYPEASAVLTLRSPQHATDTDGLAQPSLAEKEKRKPRLHLMGLKRYVLASSKSIRSRGCEADQVAEVGRPLYFGLYFTKTVLRKRYIS